MFFAFAVTTTFRRNRGIMVARAIDGAGGGSRVVRHRMLEGLRELLRLSR
jgi:hypothetical protein